VANNACDWLVVCWARRGRRKAPREWGPGRGAVAPPRWGFGGIAPRKFLKFYLQICAFWCIFAPVSDAAYADNESETDQRRAKYNLLADVITWMVSGALWCTESSDELMQRATAGLRSKKAGNSVRDIGLRI